MADLPTNFKDDILDTSVNTRRRYRMYENTDGTIELEDVTEYSQVGDEFGAGQINATNREVNKRFDKNMIVRNLNTINAITKEGYVPDALALKEVNDSLGGISQFIVDETTGKITGYKTEVGADTVFPFNSAEDIINLPSAFVIGIANIDARTVIKNNNKIITSTTGTNSITAEGFICCRTEIGGGNSYIKATAGTYLLIKNGSISIKTITSTTNLLSQTPDSSYANIGTMIAIRLF